MNSTLLMVSAKHMLKGGQDLSRFSVLPLKSPDDDADDDAERNAFEAICESVLTPEWCLNFHARTWSKIDELIKSCEMMKSAASRVTKGGHADEQIGTLLAGVWMMFHDSAPTDEEAVTFLKDRDLSKLLPGAEESNEELDVWKTFGGHMYHYVSMNENKTPVKVSIIELIIKCLENINFDASGKGARDTRWARKSDRLNKNLEYLQECGFTVYAKKSVVGQTDFSGLQCVLQVALNHDYIKNTILRGYDSEITKRSYGDSLKDLDSYLETSPTVKFRQNTKRAISLDISKLLANSSGDSEEIDTIIEFGKYDTEGNKVRISPPRGEHLREEKTGKPVIQIGKYQPPTPQESK